MNEGTHQASWLRIVVVYIRKTQFSLDEAHFSVSYEMNDRKKLFHRVFERIIILFFLLDLHGELIILSFFNLYLFI